MKKVTILGLRQAGLVEAPEPTASGDRVVVKVHAAPMCTEYKGFLAGEPWMVMGHEAAGEVVETAREGPVRVGDRVVVMPLIGCGGCAYCRSGDFIHCAKAPELGGHVTPMVGSDTMAQYLIKPGWMLPRIPDDISYERASLACCSLGPSFGACKMLGLTAYDTILITGVGPVGMGAIVNARFRGARVLAMEKVPYRMRKAKELGAEAVLDPRDPTALEQVRELTRGLGVDCALECSGALEAERFCIEAARRKGKVAFVGECNDDLNICVSPDMLRKGLTLMGVWHYNLNDFPKLLEVIRRSPAVDSLVSHVLPMSRIQEAFEISASHECAKIILKPWE